MNQEPLLPGIDYEVIGVDDNVSAVLLSGSHRLFMVDRSIADKLRSDVSALAAEAAAEWNEIAKLEMNEGANTTALARSRFDDGADLAINVNLTGTCNLACTYCFADGGDYGRIESQMMLDLVPEILRFIESNAPDVTRRVRFEFFGGEPLLNFPVIRELCLRSREIGERTGRHFNYRISTNLTVIPDECLELFREFSFIVSVSIDGGRETHDRNRPNKGGKGSFDLIIKNCQRVRAVGDSVTLVARMTVADAKAPLVDNVRELWAYNIFDYFQILPGVGPGSSQVIAPSRLVRSSEPGAPKSGKEPTVADGVAAQFMELQRQYSTFFQPDNRFCGILEYERLSDMIRAGALATSFCGAGRNYYTVSPDRSVMPCHRLVGEVDFQLGMVNDPESVSKRSAPWRRTVETHPTCSTCWARYLCGGNCKQENFVASGDISRLNEETCKHQLESIRGVVRHLARVRNDSSPRPRHRPIGDMFVSCGRPVIENGRRSILSESRQWRHFVPLF
jgi:uncharacterized protein